MSFCDTPEEVIIGIICPSLTYNDVLRLRLVNKQLKTFADDHLKIRTANHELEINETDRTLKKFMTLNISAARFYFNVMNNVQYFTKFHADITKFLEKYGEKITHFRVRFFHAFTVDGEMDFYAALTNLKHLELEEVDARKRKCIGFRNGKRANESPFPDNFKELETLKFGVIHWSGYMDVNYQWDMFNFCEKLVYFKHAFYPEIKFGPGNPFGSIPEAIVERKAKFPNGPHLKYYDINNLECDDTQSSETYRLLGVFSEHDIMLLNVEVGMLEVLESGLIGSSIINRAKSIMSLRNVASGLFCFEMPNLEKITIDTIFPWHDYHGAIYVAKWPKLKTLNLSAVCSTNVSDVKQLLDFFFEREEPLREQLTELTINLKLSSQMQSVNSKLPLPGPNSIVATCPNLTKLTLVSYLHPGRNKAFSKLWKGLQFLQELCIENCTTLGDAGFVGKNVDRPTFLRLKCLKKLTLKGLDKMPNITDAIFKTVFCHMKLTHFIIQSDKPITSISQQGVSWLLIGEFGKSIEKFPFQGWSISGVSEKEFKLLGSHFRSSYMI